MGKWKVGMGLYIYGAGPSGDTFRAIVAAISGNVLTLDRKASTSVSGATIQNDDTLAIQAAITAYCSAPSLSNGGSIFFPPGNYIYTQPQIVSPNDTPFQTCAGMHIIGGNSGAHNGTPFVMPPTASLLPKCGPRMNTRGAFESVYPNGNVTFENIVIVGCNNAIGVYGGNVVHFQNTYLSVGYTGLSDNTPLHLSDTFWVYFNGGGLTTDSTTAIPTLLVTGDSCSGCYVGVGDIYMEGMLLAGGPISYIQRGNMTGAPPGHWVFRNITHESGGTDLITITNPGNYGFPAFAGLTLDDVQESDNSDKNSALVSLNSAQTTLNGLYVNNSASTGPIVRVIAGTLRHYFVLGCEGQCGTMVVDANGNTFGNGVTQNSGGFDFTADVTDYSNIDRLSNVANGPTSPGGRGSSVRFFESGSKFASAGIDPQDGFMFGSHLAAGWNAQFSQSTAPDIDISFAIAMPPSNVTATVSPTGGSLRGPQTLNLYVVATTDSRCDQQQNFSGPSAISPDVILGTGAIYSLNVSWTPAPNTGALPIVGYCVLANGNGAWYNSFDQSSSFISGATTSSAKISSFPIAISGYYHPISQMKPVHKFTPTGLGIGNTNPQYALDVIGGGRFTQPIIATIETPNDNFKRADASTLGTNWAINQGGMPSISSNHARGASVGGTNNSAYYVGTFGADQWSKATIAVAPASGRDSIGVTVRNLGTGTSTHYGYVCAVSERLLYKFVRNVPTNPMATVRVNPGCSPGDTLELVVIGTKLTAYYNGVQDIAITDGDIASGNPGIETYNRAPAISMWSGSTLAPDFAQPGQWLRPQNFAGGISVNGAAGFSGTKTVGSCTLTIASGVITGVSGC